VAWTAVYLVLRVVVLHEPMSGSQILRALVDATVYPHLYFLWIIAGLYLCAPLLAAFLRDGTPRSGLTFALVAVALTTIVFIAPGVLGLFGIDDPVRLQALTFWLAYVGYFLMGRALSQIAPRPRWLWVAGIVGLIALTVFEVAEPGTAPLLGAFLRPDYQGAGVAVLSILVFLTGTRLLEFRGPDNVARQRIAVVADSTFGVFLVHLLVLLLPYELIPGFREQKSLLATVCAYLMTLVLSFAISLAARRIPMVRAVF
jgi:surface polysaccharide O-acyltransferase-like enzyme